MSAILPKDGLHCLLAGSADGGQVNVLTWNDEYIKNITAFAVEAREVMGPGFLETVPPASFSTRFVAK